MSKRIPLVPFSLTFRLVHKRGSSYRHPRDNSFFIFYNFVYFYCFQLIKLTGRVRIHVALIRSEKYGQLACARSLTDILDFSAAGAANKHSAHGNCCRDFVTIGNEKKGKYFFKAGIGKTA